MQVSTDCRCCWLVTANCRVFFTLDDTKTSKLIIKLNEVIASVVFESGFHSYTHYLASTSSNYEIADHCVTLKKSGTLSQVESLRSMNRSDQLSTTTEQALRNLPRSPSEEIFDRVRQTCPCPSRLDRMDSFAANSGNRYSGFIALLRKTWSNQGVSGLDAEFLYQPGEKRRESM